MAKGPEPSYSTYSLKEEVPSFWLTQSPIDDDDDGYDESIDNKNKDTVAVPPALGPMMSDSCGITPDDITFRWKISA